MSIYKIGVDEATGASESVRLVCEIYLKSLNIPPNATARQAMDQISRRQSERQIKNMPFVQRYGMQIMKSR